MPVVTVLGTEHNVECLVARFRELAMAGGDIDGFPWCTCYRDPVTGALTPHSGAT
jgi:hypothetical protein